MFKVTARVRGGLPRNQPSNIPTYNFTEQNHSMRPSLIEAISRGCFQQVRYLIRLGADVDERDESGRTPLMLCAFVEDCAWGVGLARTLIENGASGSFRDARGLNVFHYACVYERVELTRTLLNAIDFDLNQGDKHGNTALHYAADSGNAYITKMLVDALIRYKLSVDKPNRTGVTPLIQAWKSAQVICADILVNHGGADEDWRDYVESKSGREWRDEILQNMGAILARRQKQRASLSLPGLNRNRKSASRFRRSYSGTSNGRPKTAWPDKENRLPIVPLENELLAMKDFDAVIRSASPAEVKARLEHTLNESHVETFITQLRPRPRTAIYVSECDSRKNERNTVNNAVVSLITERSASSSCESVANSWKSDIRVLFHALQFQCSASFRPSVRTMTSHADDMDLQRSMSPSPSDTTSDDHHSNSSRKSSRRNSSLSAKSDGKKRPPSVSQPSQLNNNANKTKKNSNESLRSSIDSSSTESLATSAKISPRGKKASRDNRRSSVTTNVKDDSSDSSSQHTDRTDKSSASSGSGASISNKSKDNVPRPVSRMGTNQNSVVKDVSANQRRDSDASGDSAHNFASPLAAIDESQE